jgi:molybdopterin-guanine dinucleotide biosynthesis protein A
MGADKALLPFAGVPLVQIALDTLAEAGIPAKIAGARLDLRAFAEQIPDILPESGPLGGVHAALTASAAEWNLFLPVDMPLMPASLLACLLERAHLTNSAVTAVTLNGRLEPFPVVLRRTALPAIANRLAAGKRGCGEAWLTIPETLHSSLDAVPVEHLRQCGQCRHPDGLPPVLWFRSANTPQDLATLAGYRKRPIAM